MTNKSIGNFLSELRKEKNLTQREVADYLGVSDKTVSHWECDKYSPDISVIPILAEYFGVTCDEILKGERKAPERNENNFNYEPLDEQSEFEKYAKRKLESAYNKLKTSNVISIFVSAFALAFLVIIFFIIDPYIPIEFGAFVSAGFSACLGMLITYTAYQKFISTLKFCELDIKEYKRWKKKANMVCIFPVIYAVLIFLFIVFMLLPNKGIEVQTETETFPPVSVEFEGSTESLGDTSEPYMEVPTSSVVTD